MVARAQLNMFATRSGATLYFFANVHALPHYSMVSPRRLCLGVSIYSVSKNRWHAPTDSPTLWVPRPRLLEIRVLRLDSPKGCLLALRVAVSSALCLALSSAL